MPTPLRVLIVEDSDDDLALIMLELRRQGYDPEFVCARSESALLHALGQGAWDIGICDYEVPGMDFPLPLERIRAHDPDLPVIIVSGKISDATAVRAIKSGAQDYILKDNLVRLGAAVKRELHEAALRRSHALALRARDEALREANQRLQALSHRVLDVQECERRAIARELHDEVGGALTAIRLQLCALRASGTRAKAMSEASQMTERLLKQVRTMSLALRPSQLDDFGIAAALRWHIGAHVLPAGPTIDFIDEIGERRFAAAIETACYRVGQESITNALRHAAARRIGVALRLEGDALVLEVEDDGCGFDPVETESRARRGASLGILGMRERAELAAGRLSIEPARARAARRGTRVRAAFPAAAAPEKETTA